MTPERLEEIRVRAERWASAHRGIRKKPLVYMRAAADRAALLAEVDRLRNPGVCEWFDDGPWESGCGHGFHFDDGGPLENGCTFCMFCGRPLEEAPEPEEDEGGEE